MKQQGSRIGGTVVKWLLVLYLPVMLVIIMGVLHVLGPDDGNVNNAGVDGALGMAFMLMMSAELAGFVLLGIAVIFLTCPCCSQDQNMR